MPGIPEKLSFKKNKKACKDWPLKRTYLLSYVRWFGTMNR